jgi:methyltransferase (TIGR00027 family)
VTAPEEPPPEVAPVGRTALLTASARAAESRRPDRLFTDPWAAALLEASVTAAEDDSGLLATRAAGTSELGDFFAGLFTGRTPFFDAVVAAGVDAGVGQVVILAAGLDARAARLDLPPGTTVFEVDDEAVLRFKGDALAASGLDVRWRVPVAADLAGSWLPALVAAGFDPARPTVWLVEGLLYYLDGAACARLLESVVQASAAGSRVAVEYPERPPAVADFTVLDGVDAQTGDVMVSLFAEGPPGPPGPWLTALGAEVDQVTDVAAELAHLGRTVPRVLDPARPGTLVVWLASARIGASA